MRQHNAHCDTRLDYLFDSIMEALNVDNIIGVVAWYACGDDLI